MIKQLSLQEVKQLTLQTYSSFRGEHSALFREWKAYFDEYNADPNNRRLGMGCFPCYAKVFFYIKKKEQVIHGEGKEPEGIKQSLEGG